MPFDRFLVAPINSGLQTDIKPWLIMDDAFSYLQNAYAFRGRIRKRFGTNLMGATQLNSRLRGSLASAGAGVGITNGAGAAAGNIRTILADATLPLNVGQMFSVGTQIYTIISAAAGAQPMLATSGSGTFNITTGDYTIAGAPILTAVFFYPSFPVMGLTQYESGAINNHPSYGFDTRYAYLFSGNGWTRSGAAIWRGNNTNYFWDTNWHGLTVNTVTMYVTNFQVTNLNGAGAVTDDPIWFTSDGSTWASITTAAANGFYFLPAGGARTSSPFVVTSRIILPFKNRLVLLNTVENNNAGGFGAGTNSNYPQRCRYSFNGSPLANNAWYEPNQVDATGLAAAGAGFIDAATDEQIISAEFIKDRLIVYFERSTWELAYTGNEILPFVWQKINTELGSQATFSTVPFDKAVLSIGNTGIHACNGANVERIDSKIPDQIFEFQTKNNATQRTCGIRDYFTEMVYWAYVSDLETATQTFPNQILVYNYKNSSWAINDDCFTVFGYFEQQGDTTWASSTPSTWANINATWISGVLQAEQRQILAGTPEGFVLIIDVDQVRNAPSMQITNIIYAATGILTLTVIDHNMTSNPTQAGYDSDFILIESVVGDAATQAALNGKIFQVQTVLTANTFTINTTLTSGTYNGGGTAARVSNIQLTSKQFNPYVSQDRNVYLHKVDFAVEKTVTGQITVDYYPSSTTLSMITEGISTGAIMGTGILETSPYPISLAPLEQIQELLWHSIYFQATGEFIQLFMYFSLAQMTNPQVTTVPFEIQGFTLYTKPSSSRMQ